MLIAEELVLAGMDVEGRNLMSSYRNVAVGGAFLTELALMERVDVDGKRLRVLDGSSIGDPLLDEALVRFAEREGKKPKNVLERVGKQMVDPLMDGLVRQELVRPQPVKALGLTVSTRWPAVKSRPRDAIVADITRVVIGVQEADSRTGALISLLYAVEALPKVVGKDERPGMSNRDVKRRGKEISKGRWAPEAVKKAVEEAQAATMAAIAASSAAASGGGGG